jgi:hypothetical protein
MSFQKPRPYICSDPECGASYVRKEHLLRHEAQHGEPLAHVCEVCGIGFSRRYFSQTLSFMAEYILIIG